MKNQLIFSSFLFATILCSSINSAFCVSDDLTFTMPGYTSIEVDNSSVFSGSATPISKTSITLNSPMSVTFNVSSNEIYGFMYDNNNTAVGIIASVPVENNSSKTIDLSNGYIVFTKADGSTTSSAVTNIIEGTPSAENNPNAIAFPISCTQPDYSGPYHGRTDVNAHEYYTSYDTGLSSFAYLVQGTKQITCTINGDSVSQTYSMKDESGNYTASLTLTQVYLFDED